MTTTQPIITAAVRRKLARIEHLQREAMRLIGDVEIQCGIVDVEPPPDADNGAASGWTWGMHFGNSRVITARDAEKLLREYMEYPR